MNGLENIISSTKLLNVNAKGATTEGQKGTFQGVGLTLVTNSIAKMISEASEEAAMAIASKKSNHTKKITNARSDAHHRVEDVQKLLEAALKVEKRNQLEDLMAEMSQGKNTSLQALMQRLEDLSDDASDQYIMLLAMRQHLGKSSGNEIPLQSINSLIEKLFKAKNSQLSAGLHSLLPAIDAEQAGLSEASELREYYKEFVLKEEHDGLSSVWNSLVERYGESRFLLAAGFMLKALSADYQAEGSSIDKAHLHQLMREMNFIKMLTGCFDECCKTARIVDPDAEDMPRIVMDNLLILNDVPWAQEDDIYQFLTALGEDDLELQIQILVSARSAVGLIPKEAYEDPEQVFHLLETMILVLDNLIKEEEDDG